jgi:hypothetical protein
VSRFWPIAEAAQADYERLREAVLAMGRLPDDLASARFARRGLAGLIAGPAAKPVFDAVVVGAARPRWSPYSDPRTQTAAAVYRLLVGWADVARAGSAPLACSAGVEGR